MKSYRQYYFDQAVKQLNMALTILWNGVIMNKGHHSHWNKK